MRLACFLLPLNMRKPPVFQVPLQPVQDFRNPDSLHLIFGRQSISCWALARGSWHPVAPPALPIHQHHSSVLRSAGTGQPWTWATSVLNRAGSTRCGISHHPRAAGPAHSRENFVFPSTYSPSYHAPHQASQERSPVPSKTPNSPYFIK